MEIKFLKQHLTYKTGEVANLPDGNAQYLIKMGVAEKAGEKPADEKPTKSRKKNSK